MRIKAITILATFEGKEIDRDTLIGADSYNLEEALGDLITLHGVKPGIVYSVQEEELVDY